MADEKLYQSFIELGFENYLKDRGNGTIYQEAHMVKIDSFVKNLSAEQKKILKDKTNKKKNETHEQHNDVFHEINIACAFYDNIEFLPEKENQRTPDFRSNNIFVEVKTINNSIEERKRQEELNEGSFCDISPAFTEDEVEKIKKEYIDRISKKFTDHINKAKEQLNSNGGHIWVVYAIDSPPKFHEKINKEIENKFDEIIKKVQSENFCIRYISFEALREKIAS
ncbi:MAG: hypothetical protein ABIG73_00115 [Patescibacteria group bacterium]